MTYRRLLACGLLLSVAACAPSAQMRNLSTKAAPFVVATHASVPAVERAFASQSARTAEETTRYASRTRTAKRRTDSVLLLWALNKNDANKRSMDVLERVRAHDAAIRTTPTATAASQAEASRAMPAVSGISKLTKLLGDIEKGKTGGFDAILGFAQKTWEEMKKLEEDAEASEDPASDAVAAPQ